MAQKKNDNRLSAKVSKSTLKAIESLEKSSDKLLAIQGTLPKDLINAGKALDELSNAINKNILQTYNSFVGLGQDYSAHEVNQILALSQKNALNNKKAMSKVLKDFKTAVSSSDKARDVVQNRKDMKASLYSSYDLILNIIPKMRLALNTIANSVISPDDFSKRSLSFFFEEASITRQDKEEINRRLEMIIEKFEIEKDLKEDVVQTLVKGECAWAVLSMNDELKSLLKESYITENNGYETLGTTTKGMLRESVTASQEERFLFQSGYSLFNEDGNLKEDDFSNNLDDFLNEIFVIGNSKNFLSEDAKNKEEIETSRRFEMKSSDFDKKEKDLSDEAIDGLKLNSDSAVVRKLKVDQLVKLEYDNKVYGYIYIDALPIDEASTSQQRFGSANSSADPNSQPNMVASSVQNVLYSSNDIDKAAYGEKKNVIVDPKLNFIADVFVNRLSKKENVKLLKKSDQLKNVIYHSLITKRITRDEKIRVLFFTPDEVVHIDRGQSIFDNILFFAKLYIATLVTILMQNIVRGADKRAYYIDIGLENDAANAINSTIRDIKAKDLTNVHNMDVNSMLNVLGEFHDFYIPTIDGEKPIEISTVDGLQNISLDNDFLNWLSNNIFSGIGIPSAYLTEVENIDFAKTLAMQNSRFIRDIVSEQVIFGYGYSELLKKIYIKEYGSSAKDDEDDKKKSIKTTLHLLDINSIEVKFPSPVSLNMTNMNDQINNLGTMVDALSPILDIPAADIEAAGPMFKREMFKKFLPNLNWDDIDEITQKVKKSIQTSKIQAYVPNSNPPPEDGQPVVTSADADSASSDLDSASSGLSDVGMEDEE